MRRWSSPVPPVALAARAGTAHGAPPAHEERAGWPALERVDRRGADPRTGMFSEEFVRLARSVLDDPTGAGGTGPRLRLQPHGWRPPAGRAATAASWPAAPAAVRAAAARPRDEEVLRCPRCGETRPVVCAACGRLRMKTLRAGVSRLREELAALLGVDVGRGGRSPRRHGERGQPRARRRPCSSAPRPCCTGCAAPPRWPSSTSTCTCLAPRLSATEETLALLVRAARLVGRARRRRHVGPGAGADPGARPPRPDAVGTGSSRPRCWRRRSTSARGLGPAALLARWRCVSGALRPGLRRGADQEAAAADGQAPSRCRRSGRAFPPPGARARPLCDLLAGRPGRQAAACASRSTRRALSADARPTRCSWTEGRR